MRRQHHEYFRQHRRPTTKILILSVHCSSVVSIILTCPAPLPQPSDMACEEVERVRLEHQDSELNHSCKSDVRDRKDQSADRNKASSLASHTATYPTDTSGHNFCRDIRRAAIVENKMQP